MKPEFMRLRRAIASTLAALLIAAGIVVLSPALSASAHDYKVKADCENGLSVVLTSYPSKTAVTVVIDGTTTVDTTFGGNWSKSFTWDSTKDHSYTVTVLSPDDPNFTRNWSFTKSGTVKACKVPDSAKISITADTCTVPGGKTGTVSFSLSGVTKTYKVELLSGSSSVLETKSSGGSGVFSTVAAGTYTVRASAPGEKSATSDPVTVATCAPVAPEVALDVAPCLTGGTTGTVTANLSKLTVNSSYVLALYSTSSAVALETLPLTATQATFSHTFGEHGPGTYYIEVTDAGGAVLTTSAHAAVLPCPDDPTITVQLEPCALATGPSPAERELSVTVDGLDASTIYTVQLVTDDAAATVVSSVVTPGTSASFTHIFTNVPSPGDYRVTVTGPSTNLVSDSISAPLCDLPTMAPPSIELAAPVCDDVTSPEVLTARMIDLDATKTYYVRIVDSTGATVPGGDDQTVTGSTTATVTFPAVPVPGTYTAQLLIDPGKQLAATSGGSVDLTMCLPTLALTGPGVLLPLSGAAALLLTLGGAIVTGRLRRRMAL